PKDEPLAIGGLTTVKDVYTATFSPHALDEEQQKLLMGLQGQVWTEYMPSAAQVQYMAFPGCARSPSGRGAPRSRAGRSSRSVCAPICRVWTPSASATARWTEMSSSHRDAHPYGRSADDVRRRDQRLRRTRRLRATQLAIFSILAVALVVIGVYAVGELREPVEDPGVIAEKSFGPEQIELTCPD